jgi:hypothetical protein
MLAFCLALVGCGSKSAADAKKELLETSKKMDGDMSAAVVEYVKYVEDGEWSWSMADEEFRPGKFAPETVEAYKKWRAAKIAESKK